MHRPAKLPDLEFMEANPVGRNAACYMLVNPDRAYTAKDLVEIAKKCVAVAHQLKASDEASLIALKAALAHRERKS